MNTIFKCLIALALVSGPLTANAQLISVDRGFAAIDRNGLMWANAIGLDLFWSPTGGEGTAQGWISSLNASNFGGYNDWTLATGDASRVSNGNTTTNQLAELFFEDCGNSPSTDTNVISSLNNPGYDCTALSAVNAFFIDGAPPLLPGYAIFYSASIAGYDYYGATWWVFITTGNDQTEWDYDDDYNGENSGAALAVRRIPPLASTALYSFCSQSHCTDGATPYAGLLAATNGDLYGTTQGGGANSYGTVFKLTVTGKLTTIHTFCPAGGSKCKDGAAPSARLIQGTDGNFYGTTQLGGTNGNGTVFKIASTGKLTTLYSFCSSGGGECTDGAAPSAGLTLGTDGNFYGVTESGGAYAIGGTAFKITPTGLLTTLYSFCVIAEVGDCPNGTGVAHGVGLIQGTDGNLYGTTAQDGTVFKITPEGALTTLYRFCSEAHCADGFLPYSGLIEATDGNFYGTTTSGGAHNWGTIFRLTPGGTLTTLYNFCSEADCADGRYPYGTLTQSSDGDLYGITQAGGGAEDGGTVFKITPAGVFTTLVRFCSQPGCEDGWSPSAGLAQGAHGTLYGTTASGGAYGDGTIFKLSVDRRPFATLRPAAGKAGAAVTIPGSKVFDRTGLCRPDCDQQQRDAEGGGNWPR
jgi:uncharacterized repeat protein (TIGR03803 family)